jgi:hypothetical protein
MVLWLSPTAAVAIGVRRTFGLVWLGGFEDPSEVLEIVLRRALALRADVR